MFLRRAAAIVLVLVLAASPAFACKKAKSHHGRGGLLSWQKVLFHGLDEVAAQASVQPYSVTAPDLAAYEGVGSWIDIFNTGPWANPKRAVTTMAERGAKSIFLQTSTYGQSGGIYDEEAVDAFLHHAHQLDMKVVAWYVPSFTQQKVDLQRSLRAINYRSPSGERFDSFGLDIEATHVGDIGLRNKRLLALSKRIRKAAGPSYPLSAITPDPIASSYWPSFPWKATAKIFDVIVPMGYFTFRAHGFQDVRDYTSDNIRMIRRETKDKDVPIHFIGGIADAAGPVDLKGFVKATREHEVMGASLYDYPITSRRSWYEMRAFDETVAQRRRLQARREAEEAAERARIAHEKKREEREERERAKKQKAERRKKNAVDGAKEKAKSLTGSHSPSSSASRRGSRSSADQREREHRRPRARNRQHRRS